MHLITHPLPTVAANLETIPVSVDRHKLARRRWRGTAADGTDFGFDLIEALSDGDCIYITDTAAYVIEQEPEACLQISLGSDPVQAARVGWLIGNLHFKAAFTEKGVLVQDDLAVRQMLDREHIHYLLVSRVFQPSRQGGHSHDHTHEHHHY